MDFFFCLPIIVGCPTKVKPDGDQEARICPRCHNAAMFSAKSRTWFEFCFVPLIPMNSKHVWMCGICQLQVNMQPGQWEPQLAQPGYQHPQLQGQYGQYGVSQNAGYGYQPSYTQNQK
ncbi:hypothetical protein K503DRAFT_715301 [Rhizopogon vinicolor AM-OR11-026]|uniref:Uncharacterized protein n=1 Tax=Rhizopogon vinicolor AM-OR11-026 TaxID=1314800 RepID=A0A1B7N5B4_9AGAM|nr:hypothetical protein K503DRAFT_715301 [Rhizopogon vinicolor AM-OR11-026]